MTEQLSLLTPARATFDRLRFGQAFHFGRRDEVYVKTGTVEYRTRAEPRRYHRVRRPITVYLEAST